MNTSTSHSFTLAGAELTALSCGGLYWADQAMLCVSDLHLGKSERMARRGGAMLPPYETNDTLDRLDRAIEETRPSVVVCLGDSFDDRAAAAALEPEIVLRIARMQAGRQWVWIEGNHDPGPVELGGDHRASLCLAELTFRHIAEPGSHGEISGHYHPKATLSARGHSLTRSAFLYDESRLIMPAFGTYTGGLRATSPILQALMAPGACAVLTGNRAIAMPMPRVRAA